MEQTATSTTSLLLSAATEDELVVAQILLDLKTLMSLSESLSGFNWVRRRKRSCLEPPKPPAPLTATLSYPPTSPENRIEERRANTMAEEAAPAQDEKQGGAARATTSPNTPLSFPPSESDEKHKHSLKKSSKKRSREKYLDTIYELTQQKKILVGEVEKVGKYYNELKAYNSKLKAMKQEVLNSGINLGMESRQARDCQHTSGPIAAHLQDDGLRLDRGPLGIDLNILPEEAFGAELYQPLDASGAVIDDKRARFAEARRRRMGIMKSKSSRNY